MTRKQLPKAINRTGTELRVIGAPADPDLPDGTAPAASVPEQTDGWAPSQPPANDALPAAASFSLSEAETRLRAAFKIVERHKMYAGLGGLVPMPAVNVVSVTAVNLRMVKALGDLYGVPFERDKTRSIVIGLMGGAAPAGLGAATAATFVFAAPVAGAFGIAVSTVAAASLTRRIGLYFIETFERRAAE